MTINNCAAVCGGGVTANKSAITLEGHSLMNFNNNYAVSGGAFTFYSKSIGDFKGSVTVLLNYNSAKEQGGAIISNMSDVLFTQNAQIAFNGNIAKIGNSIFSSNNSTVTIDKNSAVKFNKNFARWSSGELYLNRGYDIIVDTNGTVTCNRKGMFPVCIDEICFCKDIDHALANLTMSNNVLISLTTDVTLSSVVTLKHLENFTIVGHNNPTIHCSNTGGLQFISCHDCKLESINWNKCGSDENDSQPGIKFENSSDIVIQNCSFQQSVGISVALSKVSGDININNCKFMNITHDHYKFKGHGAALYYSSSKTDYLPLQFVISNCSFTGITGALSVVYLGHNYDLFHNVFIIRNTTFINNKGTAVYISNQNLYVEEMNVFINNQAESGSCIYAVNFSKVIFSNYSTIKFNHNTVTDSGAGIYLNNHASVSFEDNSKVEFNNNNATKNGGSICSNDGSTIVFKGNSNTQFSHNSAMNGGALYCKDDCDIIFDEQGMVTFEDNKAELGGAMYASQKSHVVLTGNSSLEFQNNVANKNGGSICFCNISDLIFKNNTLVLFHNNTAINGGAVYFETKSNLKFQVNSTVIFIYNRAHAGGAIFSQNTTEGDILQQFIASSDQNIYSDNLCGTIFEDTCNIKLMNNEAGLGGAIYGKKLNVIFNGSSTAIFTNNNAEYGGAIYLETNGNVIFQGNSLAASARKEISHQNCAEVSNTFFTRNPITTFSNNRAKYDGGGVFISKSSVIKFTKESRCTVGV